METVAVLGGSGFIGKSFLKRLKSSKNYNVVSFDKVPLSGLDVVSEVGDIRDQNDLKRFFSNHNPHIVIILAAEHGDNVSPRSLYWDVNVEGSRKIAEIANQHRVKKIIFVSSVAVYGFAPIGTDENGIINPYNEYGRTKFEAETLFVKWQNSDPDSHSLLILRPTVVFGEGNRGNVFNLFRQIRSGNFVMVGRGRNRKSLAYVENLTAFLEYCLGLNFKYRVFNFVDKPDFEMTGLVSQIREILGMDSKISFRIPFWLGYLLGRSLDLISLFTGKKFAVSGIRVLKFCSNSVFSTSLNETGFQAPFPIDQALQRTIYYEFPELKKK
ncbi:MAG: NAD-dependent epimerase/dehydratase family protein [Bacteroidetes bacterium]|nr:NAD-dependent epimerase/dehydratase family protein [Bacteroidota bacterium]